MKSVMIAGCGAALLAVVGCRGGGGQERAPVHTAGAFDADVLRVASRFRTWARLTRTAQDAPGPRTAYPSYLTTTHFSESGDSEAHGRRVYHLYAMDSRSYFAATGMYAHEPGKGDPAPLAGIRQALVVDSFRPEPVDAASMDAARDKAGALAQGRERDDVEESVTIESADVAYHGAARMRAGVALGQFVMIDYGAGRAGTDDGWVYATVAPSGEIVQAGMIESCMGCHRRAAHGRLFGLGRE